MFLFSFSPFVKRVWCIRRRKARENDGAKKRREHITQITNSNIEHDAKMQQNNNFCNIVTFSWVLFTWPSEYAEPKTAQNQRRFSTTESSHINGLQVGSSEVHAMYDIQPTHDRVSSSKKYCKFYECSQSARMHYMMDSALFFEVKMHREASQKTSENKQCRKTFIEANRERRLCVCGRFMIFPWNRTHEFYYSVGRWLFVQQFQDIKSSRTKDSGVYVYIYEGRDIHK